MIRNISVSCVKIFFKNCEKKERDKKRVKYIYTEPYMEYFHRFTLQHDKNTARATENKQRKNEESCTRWCDSHRALISALPSQYGIKLKETEAG